MRPDVTRWLDRRTSHGRRLAARRRARGQGQGHGSAWSCRPSTRSRPSRPSSRRSVRTWSTSTTPSSTRSSSWTRAALDATAEVARRAGRDRGHARADVLPEIPVLPGKGEVLWRSLAATTGDVLVFVDADLEDFSSSVGHRLCSARCSPTARSRWSRASTTGRCATASWLLPAGGGRVTELVARPLLNLHWPELAGVVQPLVGEYAARRGLLEQLPFPTGYGVELALLVDTLGLAGLDAHRPGRPRGHACTGTRTTRALGRMAAEIWQAALRRLDPAGRTLRPHGLGATLAQFERDGRRASWHTCARRQRHGAAAHDRASPATPSTGVAPHPEDAVSLLRVSAATTVLVANRGPVSFRLAGDAACCTPSAAAAGSSRGSPAPTRPASAGRSAPRCRTPTGRPYAAPRAVVSTRSSTRGARRDADPDARPGPHDVRPGLPRDRELDAVVRPPHAVVGAVPAGVRPRGVAATGWPTSPTTRPSPTPSPRRRPTAPASSCRTTT